MVVGFTGHRPTNLWGYRSHPGYKMLSERLTAECARLITLGAETFISGMALGSDTIAFDACVKLRKEHPIRVVAAVPYEMQAKKWDPEHRARYEQRLEQADEIVYVDALDAYGVAGVPVGVHHDGKLLARNQYIVDQARLLVAVWWPRMLRGGTYDAVQRAQAAGRELIVIDPFVMYPR